VASRRVPRRSAAFTLAVLVTLLLVYLVALAPVAAADEFTQVEMVQLSQDCATSASSSLAARPPCEAVDGTTTAWWAAISLRYPQRWQVDLGEPHHVVKASTAWLRFAVSRKYFYKIEGSLDGETWQLLADRSKSSAYNFTNDYFDAVVRYVRVRVLRSTVGRAGIKEFRLVGDPTVADTTTVMPPPEPSDTPTPVVTGTANRLVLTPEKIAALRDLVATPGSVEAAAWAYFRDGKVTAAMAASPNVDPGPTIAFTYTKLDTDSRHARNLALAYAVTGDSRYASKAAQFVVAWAKGNTPAPYSFTGDYQGGYHQSFGAFSFAYAYDLTRDCGAYDDAAHTAVKAWFRTWATVMKGYQDNWAKDWVFSQAADGDWRPYEWTSNPLGLRYSRYDKYMGGDTTLATMTAWLGAAIVSDDTTSLATLFSSTYKLNVPECLHRSCAPRNDGDGRATTPVPQCLIKSKGYYDNPERGGNLDYMSYNARLATILYQMSANLGRATSTMRTELRTSWLYLSKFAGPGYEPPVAPNDLMHWDIYLARVQMALHVFGDAEFLADVTGGQYPRAQFYESQFLGPTTLTHAAL
jgi:hypothetical protein